MKNLLFILICFLAFNTDAQIEFKAKVSKDAVMINEPFALEYTVNSTFDNFILPEFENLKVISGPMTSMQQSINMSNGEMVKKVSVTYTYYVKAVNPGNFVLESAEIEIGNDSYKSDEVNIIVIDMEYRDPNENQGKDIKGTQKL